MIRSAVVVFVAALVSACGARSEREAASFPNAPVILISIDTLRSDHVGAYGARGVSTPHIDALRADSVLFERAYSHCPMTLPSHVSILTGLLPTEHGVRNNIGYRLERGKFPTLASVFRAHGYRTGAAVSSYVLRSETGIDDGFESYDDAIPVATAGAVSEHQRTGAETLRATLPWLDAHASEPFFFFFHIYEPHAPYEPTYDADVTKADAVVGQLIDHLKQRGIYDRAIVVVLSDHGEGLWQHGEDQHGILLYREALQVPLLVKLPSSNRKNTSVARPVALRDVDPTILALAGIAPSKRSLLTDAPPQSIYSETLYPRIHLGWSELRSLIDANHQYIDSPRPELYDLVHDASETRDLISSERRVAAAKRDEVAKYPSAIADLGTVDPEEAAKLAALGYVGTAKNRTGTLPNPRDVIGSLAEIKSGFALAQEGHDDEAVVVFRKLLEKNPHLNDVWSRLGEVLVESGRYDEAIETYKTAAAQSERFAPDLALGLGFAYLKAGKPQEALAHAELAMTMSPRESHDLMARACSALGRYPEAEQHARAAIALGDRQPQSILMLAEVQRDAGKLQEALGTIEEARRRANDLEVPHLYGIDYLRGDVLARIDRPDEAEAAFREEIAHSPQHLASYSKLALVELIRGNRKEAESVLDAMTRRNPHRGAYALAAKTLTVAGDAAGAAKYRAKAGNAQAAE